MSVFKQEQRDPRRRSLSGKMSRQGLTDLILVLLHEIAAPHHRRRGRRGGRRHYRPVLTPAPPQPSASAMSHRRVLERPRPLLPTGRLTNRWSSRTSMPLHGVVGVGRVPSTVEGLTLTGLHWSTDPHHRAATGRRREKKKTMSATSRWSPAP
jgi:hypothetical protein